MSKETKAARTPSPAPDPAPEPAAEAVGDPAVLLGDAGRRIDTPAPEFYVARSDGAVWINLRAEREQRRMLEELFNVALGRAPDSTRSLMDQTTATPKVTKVREAAERMADRLAVCGFDITRRR